VRSSFVAAREDLPHCASLARIRPEFHPGPGSIQVANARIEMEIRIADVSTELERLAAVSPI
jgi:hypothetical protein